MKVNLISYTQPSLELLNRFKEEGAIFNGPSDLITFCARVSNPQNQFNTLTGKKLIKYLVENKHWSPLQMVDVTLEIETTRDVSRQHLRHKSFDFQEFSQRYSEALGFEIRECRMQDPKNRQNSVECTDEFLRRWWEFVQMSVIATTENYYKEALAFGIAKEVARAILPEGLTLSRIYAKNSLRGWIHYLEVRASEKSGTQKEHRLVAKECAKVLAELFPDLIEV